MSLDRTVQVTEFYFIISALLASSFQNTAIWLYIKNKTLWHAAYGGFFKTMVWENQWSVKAQKKPNKNLPKPIPKIIWGLLKWRQGSVEVHSVNLQHECPVYLTTKKESKIPSSDVSKNINNNKNEENLKKS